MRDLCLTGLTPTTDYLAQLKPSVRVSLDMTTLTIMRILPREVDPMVYNMSLEDPGSVSFAGIGGLGDQVRELREVIELPLMNPELFEVSWP